MSDTMADVRHTYEYDVELGADTAPARVIRMIGPNRRVLEVGAGPGSITKHLIKTNNCDVVALEIDPSAIAKLKEYCSKIYSLDLNSSDWTNALAHEQKFDVVLAADVLEHVSNPLATLKQMVSLLKPGGEIVLSLPHVGHCVIGACLMDEDFDYRDWGLLDRTHIRFFGLKNINRLYADAGLSIVHAEFVVRRPEETEFADRWMRMRGDVQAALSSNPHGFVYQVVSKAQVSTVASNNIDLMSLVVPGAAASSGSLIADNQLFAAPSGIKSAMKSAARKHLTPDMRVRVKRLANKIGIQV